MFSNWDKGSCLITRCSATAGDAVNTPTSANTSEWTHSKSSCWKERFLSKSQQEMELKKLGQFPCMG